MALSSTKDFWIHPNALTFTLNYFGNPQLIQTSMLAGAVIMAYHKDYISYDAAHNFRQWKLTAYPTQLNDTVEYYVHAELSRSGNTAMIIYSPVKRDLEGRSFVDKAWDNITSEESYFIYLGTISASVDANGESVNRVWTDGFYTGTLATDQYRMEEASSGDLDKMFRWNSATDTIEVLKTIVAATINKLSVVTQFIFGGRTFTGTAGSGDSGNASKRNDATLPTTGYVAEEISALDDHFLVKDGNKPQEVGGNVSFKNDVSVIGDHTVGNNQTIEGTQEVKGLQTLHEGFKTDEYNDVAGQINGAQLTRDGFFTAKGIKAMSFEIFELVYNVIRSNGGKLAFSPTATIEYCQYELEDGIIVTPDMYFSGHDGEAIKYVYLTIKKEQTNANAIPFRHGDILYGYVNQIGESGQYARGGQCVMRVDSSDEEIGKDGSMTIRALLFGAATDNNGTAINAILPPTDGMAIAQRGTTDDNHPERRTSFFIDSQAGNIIMLQNVSLPVISYHNYGVVIGQLPSDLLELVREIAVVQDTDPAVFAKLGIFEQLIRLDHRGVPVPEENYRGHWSATTAVEDPYISNASSFDSVTHKGSKWKCLSSYTTLEPSETVAEWLLYVSKGDSSAPTYAIVPSANSIHLNKQGILSSTSLDIVVNETSSEGVFVINDQDELNDRGLKVQYAIDGGLRHDLIIGGEGYIELEDESGYIIGEDNSTIIMLEGESIDISEIEDNISIYLVDINDNTDKSKYIIPVTKDGDRGSTGAMPVISGELNLSQDYNLIKDSEGNVIGKPVCLYRPTKKYYCLEQDYKGGLQTEPKPPYWREFTKWELLMTEIFMADFAKLGGENGAIFFGDYMFSTRGVGIDGSDVKYNQSMFTDGRLNGNIIPNLFLDLNHGGAKFGKLSESYLKLSRKSYSSGYEIPSRHNILLDVCHNVSCEAILPSENVDKVYCGTSVIVLPKVTSDRNIVDGSHCTVVHEYSTRYTLKPSYEYYKNSVLAVIADEKILTQDVNNTDFYGIDGGVEAAVNGWFIWKGYRTKMILMTPGTMLKLRSCIIQNEGLVWFVENSSEFEILDSTLYFYTNYATNKTEPKFNIESKRNTDIQSTVNTSETQAVILGSPILNELEYSEWVFNTSGGLLADVNATINKYEGCYFSHVNALQ